MTRVLALIYLVIFLAVLLLLWGLHFAHTDVPGSQRNTPSRPDMQQRFAVR